MCHIENMPERVGFDFNITTLKDIDYRLEWEKAKPHLAHTATIYFPRRAFLTMTLLPLRYCGDYRPMNKFIKHMPLTMPDIHQAIQRLIDFSIFSDMDWATAFHQLPLDEGKLCAIKMFPWVPTCGAFHIFAHL